MQVVRWKWRNRFPMINGGFNMRNQLQEGGFKFIKTTARGGCLKFIKILFHLEQLSAWVYSTRTQLEKANRVCGTYPIHKGWHRLLQGLEAAEGVRVVPQMLGILTHIYKQKKTVACFWARLQHKIGALVHWASALSMPPKKRGGRGLGSLRCVHACIITEHRRFSGLAHFNYPTGSISFWHARKDAICLIEVFGILNN